MNRRGSLFTVSLVTLSVFASALVSGSSHEAAETAPGCTPTLLADIDLYSHPMVRERWDRAALVAPDSCLMPLDGDVWECYYNEAVPGLNQRLCFTPIPADFGAGAPPRLDVSIDLASLRSLADRALELPELQQLVGAGRVTVDIRVGADSARVIVENYQLIDAFYTAPPPMCVPFDLSVIQSALGPDQQAEWQRFSDAALGVCTTSIVPQSAHCQSIARVPGTRSFLCWWGVGGTSGADYRFDVSPDVLRAVLNAPDPGEVAKAGLSRGNIVIWADDLLRRAALRAALETILGDAGDLTPPPSAEGGTVHMFGREFTISYFPRDGVMTPCARDGQGTWYWLNEFGVPNGFVGTSTVEAMKRVIAESGDNPSEQELLESLYLNWVADGTVTIDGVEVPIEYVFVPGSPFSLLPVAKKSDGSYVKLKGDGSVGEVLSADESAAVAKRVRAAEVIGTNVDFNQQPGTLSQDLKFLSYAVEHNPAAPQIAALLRDLGNGTKPVPEDVAGLFPAESPRLTLGTNFAHGNVSSAVADGDAYILGMATHHLLWYDLLRYGAIQPDEEATP